MTKEDAGKGVLLTIKGYHTENVAMQGQPQEDKWVLDFEEDFAPLVLNTTKGAIIADITGAEDLDGWIGHRIVAFHDKNISMGGKLVGGIGIRAPRLGPVPGVTAPTAPGRALQPAPGRAPQPAPAPTPRPVPPRPAPIAPDAPDAAEPEDDDVPF